MLAFQKARFFRVGFLLVDGFALMSYSAAVEVLRAANLLARKTLYDIQHIPAVGTQAISSSGAIVVGTVQIGENFDFDLVLVVAGGDPENFLPRTTGLPHRLNNFMT